MEGHIERSAGDPEAAGGGCVSDLRVLPLPKVDAHYGPIGGKYPETIRIAMSDGKVITYRIDMEQPRPAFLKNDLDRFSDICVGYQKK